MKTWGMNARISGWAVYSQDPVSWSVLLYRLKLGWEDFTNEQLLICVSTAPHLQKIPSCCQGHKSVQFSRSIVWPLCDPVDCSMPGFPIHHYLLELAHTHVHRVGDAIQSSDPLSSFFSCPQSFSASGSFLMSQFFASGGQSIGASASASVLPTNIQDWFPLGWNGWISLLPRGLSEVFSNTTVQKHQFKNTKEEQIQEDGTDCHGTISSCLGKSKSKKSKYGVVTIFFFLRKNLSLQLLFSSTSNLL